MNMKGIVKLKTIQDFLELREKQLKIQLDELRKNEENDINVLKVEGRLQEICLLQRKFELLEED